MEILGELSIIFHWGLYSVPGFMRQTKKDGNGSEWILKRLTEDVSGFRPLEKNGESKKFFRETYGDMDYFDLAQFFTLDAWDVDGWMELCKDLGVTTVILTARHHDGFCLYPSNYCLNPKQRSSRDILGEFKNAASKYGLKFGIYYSWFEFDVSMTKNYVDEVIKNQIDELIEYNPDNFFFDGNWEIKTQYAQAEILKICARIKGLDIAINDRIYATDKKILAKIGIPNGLSENELGMSSYRVYEDRKILNRNPGVPFSSIQTIGNSWGANKYSNRYKTGEELYQMYVTTHRAGGNFCINFGPDEHGQLDIQEMLSAIQLRAKILTES